MTGPTEGDRTPSEWSGKDAAESMMRKNGIKTKNQNKCAYMNFEKKKGGEERMK